MFILNSDVRRILSYRLEIYRHICGVILGKNHTSVSCAGKGKVTWIDFHLSSFAISLSLL